MIIGLHPNICRPHLPLSFGPSPGPVPLSRSASFRAGICCANQLTETYKTPTLHSYSDLTSIIPILISRFILNLRQADGRSLPPSRPSRIGTLVFNLQESIVGDMGEPLDHGFGEAVAGEEDSFEKEDAAPGADNVRELQPGGSGLCELERMGSEADGIVDYRREGMSFASTDA